jgi:DNA-binding transcriptional LysR family regulator
MATIDLNLIRAFVTVRDTGSFSAAALRLGVPRSTVSRAVASLEASLGTRLFNRTTRRVSASTAGIALYDRVAPALVALEGSLADLPESEEVPSGILRITSTVDLGTALLAEASARFTARFPGTQVDVHLSNKVVDLVRDGMDLALRVSAKPLRDSSLVARKVGALSLQLYAAPSYLLRKGTPRIATELRHHEWVSYRGGQQALLGSQLAKLIAGARHRIVGDDMSFIREALKAGGGIGTLPSFIADNEVAAGTLVRVLPRWTGQTGNVYLVQSSRKHTPRKITAFRDLLIEMLRQRPLSAPV